MFEPTLVTFGADAAGGALSLVGATILVNQTDEAGVKIAANALAQDLGRVTQTSPYLVVEVGNETNDVLPAEAASGETAIIVGSLHHSSLIEELSNRKLIDTGAIAGKWECFVTAVVDLEPPLAGLRRALIIAGSDKRGAIYGMYTISEQIGVSPWHWWADIPIKHHEEIYAVPRTYTSSEPSVKYRGIFINDEAPALTGMVLEKFGSYGKEFHIKVFDLLLRLKANFMWPAMWPGYPNPGSSFFVDDVENQKTANDYGIVMSTSHHEPMQRATNEWFETNPRGTWSWLTHKEGITDFFDEGVRRAKGYESYFTIGMRGEYDKAMATDDPAAVVRDVIKTQRSLIRKHHGKEESVPQLLALYKEVQEYYDAGKLDVPDDVTLLFADDNFGSIRRLPAGEERHRKGGAGIYYHFEYVGHPRSYKWINSNSMGKTWHQLQEAHRRHARDIWVFNVGDIKPMEVPLTFAMALAWNIASIPADTFAHFYNTFARREFGSELARPVAEAWQDYDRLVSLRRHEHIEADDFSLLHYEEANQIESHWRTLSDRVEHVYATDVSLDYQPSFFQLVLHPIKASYIYTSLRVNQARNKLWASQRRNTANKAARKVLDLFDADFSLQEEFHQMLEGKWSHIMRQTHYGFNDTWHAPSRDMIRGLCFVQARQDSNPLVGQLGVMVEGHAGIRPGVCNEESDRTHPSRRDLIPGLTLQGMTPFGPTKRWFELFSRGTKTLEFTCKASHDWVVLSQSSGRITPGQSDVRIEATVDWQRVPAGFDEEVIIEVRTQGGGYGRYLDDFEQVHLPINHVKLDARSLETFRGFIESDGVISVPATQPTHMPPTYRVLPNVSRLGYGSVAIDATAGLEISWLEYQVLTYQPHVEVKVLLFFNMTLDFDPSNLMRYDLSIDELRMESQQLVPNTRNKGELPAGWAYAVQDCAWKREHSVGIMNPGLHKVSIRLQHSNIMLEKIVLDLGGLQPSYLGPPPSFCWSTTGKDSNV